MLTSLRSLDHLLPLVDADSDSDADRWIDSIFVYPFRESVAESRENIERMRCCGWEEEALLVSLSLLVRTVPSRNLKSRRRVTSRYQ